MINSKLIRVLKTFSKTEFKDFEKFVSSPYFANERIYLSLLTELKKYYPDFNSTKLSRENIYSILYPGKEFKDTVIFTITSGLYKLALEFLSEIEFSGNLTLKELMINQQFHKRGLNENFKVSFEMFYNKLYRNPYDSTKIKTLFDAGELALQHYSLLGKYDNLNEAFEKHTHNFIMLIIEKLSKLIHDVFVNQWSYNVNIDKITTVRFVKLFNFKKIPVITNNVNTIRICRIYNYIINFCFKQDEKTYFLLKKEVIQNLNNFSKNEQYELLIILTDFCQNLITKIPNYISELLKLHKLMLKKGIYLDDHYEFMQMALFRNILATAMRNKEFKWAEEYVQKYSLKLNPEIRDNAYSFSNAFIQFAKKNYVEALQFANLVKFEDFFYKKDIKQLTLQIYYELNYYEEFLSLCDSYKHFLNSNRNIDAELRNKYMNLITYSLIIMNIKNNHNKYPIEKLIKEIQNDKIVVSKEWLLQKITELKQLKVHK
jgi:hypothetical protein